MERVALELRLPHDKNELSELLHQPLEHSILLSALLAVEDIYACGVGCTLPHREGLMPCIPIGIQLIFLLA